MKQFFISTGIALGLALSLSPATAKDVKVGSLKIEHGYAMETRPGQPNGGAFIEVENRGKRVERLLSVSFPKTVSERGELHTMKHENGKMIMREVPKFEIPAGGKLKLQPGGDHLMLIGIKEPLKPGSTVKATLQFENAGKVEVDLTVKARGDIKKHGHDESHHGGHGPMKH
ncbi:MAG: copper chaperone PCu(A)C [Burkholderiaceae bacterium]|jgi:copper(I)-binding protein